MPQTSAGLLMFRRRSQAVEVLLVHPGGPFFRNRDLAAWSIPKGLFEGGEDALEAAKREFQEETGVAPRGPFFALGQCRMSSGKPVRVWAFEGDCEAQHCKSNTFSMEWPPKSGETCEFPEADRAEWFELQTARRKIAKGQVPFLDRLARALEAENASA